MMHPAVCDNCGKNCEVPFQPTGEKPVYCNDCFAAQGGHDRGNYRGPSAGMRRYPSRDGGRPPFRRDGGSKDYGKEIAAINRKLDKIMKSMGILEEPSVPVEPKIEPEPEAEAEVQVEAAAPASEEPATVTVEDLMDEAE